MVEFKLDSLATLPSVLNQWHFFLGMLCIVGSSDHFHKGIPEVLVAWIVIVGLFALIALIIIILGLFGIELPKEILFWYYIIGWLVILIIDCVALADLGHSWFAYLLFCMAFTMSVFYLYSAYLAKKG